MNKLVFVIIILSCTLNNLTSHWNDLKLFMCHDYIKQIRLNMLKSPRRDVKLRSVNVILTILATRSPKCRPYLATTGLSTSVTGLVGLAFSPTERFMGTRSSLRAQGNTLIINYAWLPRQIYHRWNVTTLNLAFLRCKTKSVVNTKANNVNK